MRQTGTFSFFPIAPVLLFHGAFSTALYGAAAGEAAAPGSVPPSATPTAPGSVPLLSLVPPLSLSQPKTTCPTQWHSIQCAYELHGYHSQQVVRVNNAAKQETARRLLFWQLGKVGTAPVASPRSRDTRQRTPCRFPPLPLLKARSVSRVLVRCGDGKPEPAAR